MESVDKDELSGALAKCAGELTGRILGSALRREDSRFESASSSLITAVWSEFWELSDLPPEEQGGGKFDMELSGFLDRMMGRVLTIFEGTFSAGQQCDALKSQARQAVWQIWNEVVPEEVA